MQVPVPQGLLLGLGCKCYSFTFGLGICNGFQCKKKVKKHSSVVGFKSHDFCPASVILTVDVTNIMGPRKPICLESS